ncbi:MULTISPECIES: GNAT family N-acetyltransferase [unclassified Flavobacterium]|jgi:GNAT superfamily N-acetyltransferase|uniref:GNAT family N-acetyltransferase n=2 Tax=Flavobacterium TaxID=237 RepID=UPI0025C0E11D|nr:MULTISPECIES: GNAT family N-acetyltransferase [unclassified Flavobacterium]
MKKEILGKYTLQTATPEYAKQQAELQKIVFPTLSEEELMTEEQYKRHIEIFQEGQMLVLDGDTVIASTTTLLQNYHKGHHTFLGISDNLWLGTHDPKADWLYGLDVSVHPDYQGKGIGRQIYNARQEVAITLGTKGQMTAGMPIGFDKVKDQMTIAEYCDKLIKGKIIDPTVTAQTKCGFILVEPLFDYLDDPRSGNCSVLMYWPLDPSTKLSENH